MSDEIDLAAEFAKKMKDPNLGSDYTWDDFFNEFNIPEDQRSDFVIAAILKQATEKYGFIDP